MAQHVTFWKMKVKPGKVGELRAVMSDPKEEARIKAAGWQMTIIGTRKDNPEEVWGMVTWDSSDRYYKNAESPDQDKDYQKMMQFMTGEPEWFDCDLVEESHA
jgi:hypothetical protein